MRRIAAATVLALSLALPAQAHDIEPLPLPEVPEWVWQAALVDWQSRAVDGLDQTLLGEWRWYRDTYFPPPPRIQPERRVVAQDTPNPAPMTQPAYPSGVEQWRPLVAFFWPAEHVDRMLKIMACESGGNPYADNPRSSALGLFQIMGSWQKVWPGDYTDPWTNAAVAYQIWLTQGYAAWVCKG